MESKSGMEERLDAVYIIYIIFIQELEAEIGQLHYLNYFLGHGFKKNFTFEDKGRNIFSKQTSR